MILHIPHSSFIIPPETRTSICLGQEDLKQELARMADAFTDELFDLDEPHYKVVYPVNRIVCDPERFLDDELEQVNKFGTYPAEFQFVFHSEANLFRFERWNGNQPFYTRHAALVGGYRSGISPGGRSSDQLDKYR